MSELRKCGIPDCNRTGAAIKKRGAESPIVLAGGDRSVRSKWCRYHLKGKGRPEREKYMATNYEK